MKIKPKTKKVLIAVYVFFCLMLLAGEPTSSSGWVCAAYSAFVLINCYFAVRLLNKLVKEKENESQLNPSANGNRV